MRILLVTVRIQSRFRFSATASRINSLRAASSTLSPSWTSIARTVLLSSRVLKSPFGSLTRAPLGNVSLTARLSASPMQTIPSCDHTGTPIGLLGFLHFTSSTAAGSACLIDSRSCDSVVLRQSAWDLIMASICSDAGPSFGGSLLGGIENLAQLAGECFRLAGVGRIAAHEAPMMAGENDRLLTQTFGRGCGRAPGEGLGRLFTHGYHDVGRSRLQGREIGAEHDDGYGLVGEQWIVASAVVLRRQSELGRIRQRLREVLLRKLSLPRRHGDE